MKKLMTTLAAAGSSVVAFAEGEGSAGSDVAGDIINGAQNALTSMLDTAGAAVVAVVLAGLAIWGGIRLVGLLKSAFNAGKGR